MGSFLEQILDSKRHSKEIGLHISKGANRMAAAISHPKMEAKAVNRISKKKKQKVMQ